MGGRLSECVCDARPSGNRRERERERGLFPFLLSKKLIERVEKETVSPFISQEGSFPEKNTSELRDRDVMSHHHACLVGKLVVLKFLSMYVYV